MNIIVDHIAPGKANRPNTNPASSLYKKIIRPEFIVYHNPAAPSWNAKQLHDYGKRQYNKPGLKSWNYSVDKDVAYEMVPPGEATWQASDNLGPGNTNSISMEVCDRGMYQNNPTLFWQDQENAARLCAHLIKTVHSLKKFPDCMRQHYHFSGKNCPYWVRREPGGWNRLLGMVDGFLKDNNAPWPTHPIPKIQRTIGVELNGQRTDEVGYLINNATYVRAAFMMTETGATVTGHGDHIKIVTGK